MEQDRIKDRTLTELARHKRFKAMAAEVDADESAESFDRAFASVVAPPKRAPGKPG